MDQKKLKEELTRFEGYKTKVYLDTLGLPTVGIGHMDRNMRVGDVYTDAAITILYEDDVADALSIAKRSITNFETLDDTRQRILVQLAFNMGSKLFQFKNTLKAVQDRDFDAAANGLQNSKWFTQVGRRGPETVLAMRTGEYSF